MQLNDLIGYIVMNYKNKDDLSKARLNKIIYLIDWKSAIDKERQITNIEWYFNNYGPYVSDIETSLNFDERFYIEKTRNYFGNEKNIVRIKTNEFQKPLDEEKLIIDLVINLTQELSWSEFINAVYSTFPIKESEKGSSLNLVQLAKEYKALKQN